MTERFDQGYTSLSQESQIPQLTKKDIKQQALIGWRLFTDATNNSAASVIIQGARVTIACKKDGIEDPLKFGTALRNDQVLIDKLKKAAIYIHEKRGIFVPLKSLERMPGNVGDTFHFASRFMILEDSALLDIVDNFYPKYVRSEVPGIQRERTVQSHIFAKYEGLLGVKEEDFVRAY